MTLDKVIANSGDSKLMDYKYENSRLVLSFELGETEELIDMSIKTHVLYSDIDNLKHEELYTFYIELQEVDKLLNTLNDIYIPSSVFDKFMHERRRNLNLAYGIKKSNIQLLSLVNNRRFLSCVVSSLQDIDIKIKS